MTTDTHTKAGLLATAGAARLGTVSPAACTHGEPSRHQLSSWTKGAFATPTTVMVIDTKNRPTRPLSELSP